MANFNGGSGKDFQETGFTNLFGNNGDDHLASDQPGADLLSGGAGRDFLFLSNPAAFGQILGDSGDDAVFGGMNSDFLYGANGTDVLAGGAVDFLASGTPLVPSETSGIDFLYGGAGTDALY